MKADYERQGVTFDPLEHCQHRYAYYALPDELQDAHLAWVLSNENMKDYFHIIHNFTLLEVQEALALQKTTAWIREEDD